MGELFKNERKIRILGIPLLGIFIVLIFQIGQSSHVLDFKTFLAAILYNIVITFFYWQGNVMIFSYSRKRYQEYKDIWKRMLFTFCVSLFYNAAITLGFQFFFKLTLEAPVSFATYWNNFLIGMSFTLIIGAIYEIIYYFNKWKESLIESEKLRRDFINAEYESLKNQVNPHFLFNSMNALSSLIHSDVDKADRFIEEFCKIYRYVLDKKDEMVVTVAEELDFVKSFLFLQEIRFEKSLNIHLELSGELLSLFLPPVSLQMLVENAIKHNIVTPEKPLYIHIYSDGKFLIVENNLQKRQEAYRSTGVGLKNLHAKYKIISETAPEFLVHENHYIARIPLLKEEQNEGVNH